MKQFNLDEYLKNPLKKVVTRVGESVRIICTDYYGEKPIIAKIEGCENSYPFYEDGRFLSYGEPSNCDLFFAPEKNEGWVNIYKTGAQRETLGCFVTRYAGLGIWPTEEEAKAAAAPDPIATVKIEWEE